MFNKIRKTSFDWFIKTMLSNDLWLYLNPSADLILRDHQEINNSTITVAAFRHSFLLYLITQSLEAVVKLEP